MGNLEFPSNPTSYRRTGWQIGLMAMMFVNYLMDHDPRHVKYKEDQRAKRDAEKYRYKPGFVTELPDDYEGDAYHPPPVYAPHPQPIQQQHPHNLYDKPPCVPPNGKEAYPYPREGHYGAGGGRWEWEERDVSRRAPKPASRAQMRDAWMRMRAVTRAPDEYVEKSDKRKKRVTFNSDVQWYIFKEEDDSYDGG